MKNKIILIFALFLTLTGFRSDEKAVNQSDTSILRSTNAILEPPRFVRTLQNLTVMEGQDAVFSAQLAYIDPSCRITWYKNGREITLGKKFRSVVEGNTVMLIILQAEEADQGVYGVKAANGVGEANSSATLRVQVRS